jgi:uncharacterized protein
MKILGIDLAGKPENPTGISILNVPDLETLSPDLKFKPLYEDGKILRKIKKLKPDLIAIDAPLSIQGQMLSFKILQLQQTWGTFQGS